MNHFLCMVPVLLTYKISHLLVLLSITLLLYRFFSHYLHLIWLNLARFIESMMMHLLNVYSRSALKRTLFTFYRRHCGILIIQCIFTHIHEQTINYSHPSLAKVIFSVYFYHFSHILLAIILHETNILQVSIFLIPILSWTLLFFSITSKLINLCTTVKSLIGKGPSGPFPQCLL